MANYEGVGERMRERLLLGSMKIGAGLLGLLLELLTIDPARAGVESVGAVERIQRFFGTVAGYCIVAIMGACIVGVVVLIVIGLLQ